MSTQPNLNVALIQRYYETYAQGDPELLRPFLAMCRQVGVTSHR